MQAGQLYLVEFDYELVSGSFRFALEASNAYSTIISTLGSSRFSLVITRPTDNRTDKIQIRNQTATTELYLDNVSIKEINPLSVSIGMEGRMTRESVNGSVTAMPIRWVEDGNNQIRIWHDSSIAGNGIRWDFDQEANNVIDQVSSGYINPFGILVPFDIASRHGSTFINGATNGVALTADTTPTALPDLSSTDLNLAYDYMGTISEFRVWDKDLGDDGIVEATNPSLEPSLSLTFEGTGTSSFTVSEWSE
jgi:hypothetical protein